MNNAVEEEAVAEGMFTGVGGIFEVGFHFCRGEMKVFFKLGNCLVVTIFGVRWRGQQPYPVLQNQAICKENGILKQIQSGHRPHQPTDEVVGDEDGGGQRLCVLWGQ